MSRLKLIRLVHIELKSYIRDDRKCFNESLPLDFISVLIDILLLLQLQDMVSGLTTVIPYTVPAKPLMDRLQVDSTALSQGLRVPLVPTKMMEADYEWKGWSASAFVGIDKLEKV